MIRATGITLRRGVKVLLENTEFIVNPGERLGIVGKNGAGKSSLFALLQGELDLDAGELSLPDAWQVASVRQTIPDRNRPAREFVIDGDERLRALQQARADTPDSDGQGIAELENALVEADAWSAPSRAEQLLAGLGFRPDQWMLPVRDFSGGWQMRLSLARALMAPSDLLLLDEPTNHLDLDAMLWLERWLASYPGTVLLISHDTEFLDAVARSILHLDQGKLVRYKGGYNDFLVQRAERVQQSQIAYERQTREAARLQGFIDRFKAQATKAKQAQSRVKALARMQTLAPLRVESGVSIRLPSPDYTPDPLLTLEQADLGYADHAAPILSQVRLMVRGGARVGVLGMNGAGKSTLVKTLAGKLAPIRGERLESKGLVIGYFAQHQLDSIDPDSTPLQHLARLAPDTREQELRNYLGSFGFSGDMASSVTAPFSGGEKARLALALIVWQKPNLLLLDEPTNHLDVDTREALADALADYGGSVLLVSHDRHLLRSTVDSFWIVADGQVQEFDGDLEDYRDWLLARSAQARSAARQETRTEDGEVVDRKAQRRQEAEQRQRQAQQRKPLEARLKKVEAAMDKAGARLQELDALMQDPDFYSDAYKEQRPALMAEHGELGKERDTLEEEWLELQEAIEHINQQA
ncbi:MAG TPA: ATP-binding cassette domain-containing protein [Alcaligenes sp.]|nr:ATP-binding cassette domain-containing protein [Alcaligenes sp.]HRL27374.1 ATP-binding cassette domain-containing protein [Alcaligenes sp.]